MAILMRLTRSGFTVRLNLPDEKLDEVINLCNQHFGDPEWKIEKQPLVNLGNVGMTAKRARRTTRD